MHTRTKGGRGPEEGEKDEPDVAMASFVDTVVGQVHEGVLDRSTVRIVFHRGETRQSFLVEIGHQRIVRRHRHVNANVEFVA